MTDPVHHSQILTGATWEAFMQTLLYHHEPGIKIFTRPGRDFAIDAISADGKTVYQAKYHKDHSLSKAIADSNGELEKIKKYQKTKEYWKDVKNWILFTNLEINIQDEIQFSEKVGSLFEKEGMMAQLMDWGEIRSILSKYPAVERSYFHGETRIFFTLSEELEKEKVKSWYRPALDVDCLGREEGFKELQEFLKSGKKIWAISGPGGMGKTRFLVECGKRMMPDWIPYWSSAHSVRQPTLYNQIPPEQNIVLFIDELSDPTALSVLLDQMTKDRMKSWKLIFTERYSDTETIGSLASLKMAEIVFPHYRLPKLNKEESKQLVQQFMENFKSREPIHFTESEDWIAYKLSETGAGIPLWIGLVFNLFETNEGSLEGLPAQTEKILEKYLGRFYYTLNETGIERGCAETILNWIALFKSLNLEDRNILEFLAGRSGLRKLDILKISEKLHSTGIAYSIGKKDRYIKIAPDSIRDGILKEALIDVDTASSFAIEVVNLYLASELPHSDTILETLARVEYLLFQRDKKKVNLLSRILDKILSTALNGTSQDQRDAISKISRFSFVRPLDAIQILNACLEHDGGSVDLDRRSEVTHLNLIKNIPWAAFQVAGYANSDPEQEAVYDLFLQLFNIMGVDEEDSFSNTNAPIQFFLRIFFKEYWSEKYHELAKRKVADYYSRIKSGEKLGQIDAVVFRILITGLGSAHRHISGPNYDYTITFGDLRIGPGHPFWEQIIDSSRIVKELLMLEDNSGLEHLNLPQMYASIVRSIIDGTHFSKKGKLEEVDPEAIETIRLEFQWLLDFFNKKGKTGISFADRKALQEVWKWHLKTGNDPGLQELARQCEQAHYKDEVHRMIEELAQLNYKEQEERERQINSIYEKYIQNASLEQIKSFIEKCEEYRSNHVVNSLIVEFAQRFSIDFNRTSLLKGLLCDFILYPRQTCQWDFINRSLFNYSFERRKINPEEIAELFRYALSIAGEPGHLLTDGIFARWWSFRFSDDEFQFLLGYLLEKPSEIENLQCLAILTLTDFEILQPQIQKIWSDIPEAGQRIYIQTVFEQAQFLLNYVKVSGRSWNQHWSDMILDLLIQSGNWDLIQTVGLEDDDPLHIVDSRDLHWFSEILECKRDDLESVSFAALDALFFIIKIEYQDPGTRRLIRKFIDQIISFSAIANELIPLLERIDANGNYLLCILIDKIENTVTLDEMKILARMVSTYPEISELWQNASIPILRYADRLQETDKWILFQELDGRFFQHPRGMADMFPSGRLNPRNKRELEHAKANMVHEMNPARREYRRKLVEWAQSSMDRETEDWEINQEL